MSKSCFFKSACRCLIAIISREVGGFDRLELVESSDTVSRDSRALRYRISSFFCVHCGQQVLLMWILIGYCKLCERRKLKGLS